MIKSALVIAFLCLVIASPSFSQQSSAGRTPLSLSVSVPPEGWPPYIICDEDAAVRGVMMDVLTEIAQTLGRQVQVVKFPEMRGRMLMQMGEIDAYPKAQEWVKDPDSFLWTDPIVFSEDVLVLKANSPLEFTGPESLYGLDVGVIHGFGYPTLDEHLEKSRIRAHRARTTENLIDMVDQGRIDCAVTNRLVAEWIIKNNERHVSGRFRFSAAPVDAAPYRFAFHRGGGWEPFINSFNVELAKMKADGRFEAILARYR